MNRELKPVRRSERRAAVARWLKRGALIALGLAIAFSIVQAWIPKPIEVDSALAQRAPMRVTVDEDGQARVQDRYVVSAPLAGSLARIELEPGDEVKQGQTLVRIVPVMPPLMDQRTKSASQARLSAALAAQKQVAAQIDRARANVEFSKTEAARNRTLFERGAIGRAEYDQTLLRERTAKAELDSARFGERVADHEVDMARAALKRMSPDKAKAEEQLDLPAPVSGRVLKLMQESEGVIQAGTPLLELGDPAALEIVVDVLTGDAVRMRPGAQVTIERWGGPPLEGRVRLIEPAAFTRVSALGVEEQRVNVKIELTTPRKQWLALGDGYRVEARIVVWESEDALQIPSSAVFRHEGRWATFVIDGEVARLTPIEIGERTAQKVQVTSGLEPGARVIVHPSDRVVDGASVVAR